jgi:hypothetical protein
VSCGRAPGDLGQLSGRFVSGFDREIPAGMRLPEDDVPELSGLRSAEASVGRASAGMAGGSQVPLEDSD